MAFTPKKLMVLLCVAAVLSLSLTAPALAGSAASGALKSNDYSRSNASAERMTADLFILRPIAIVGSVIGCAVYVVSLPFSLPGGNSKEVFNSTVKAPAKFAFARPLGSF
jgi:hypothetical protein